MKVLFLSVTAGHGHNQTAKSAMEYMKQQGIECKMIDTFEYINLALSESIARGYLISTKFTPAVYGRLYRLAENKEKNNAKFSISKLTNSLLSRKLINCINEYGPDVIVGTHIFAAQIISHMKNKGLFKCKTIGIVTDFTVHPFWEDTDLDYYITASEQLNNQVAKKGIPLEKIKSIGIPIQMKFSEKIEKSQAREKLGIEDKYTIFMMGGSMGYVDVLPLVKKIDALDFDFNLICVCGNNCRLKKKIELTKTTKKVYTYGFIDNVDLFMDASDIIMTKPGGLTISESLAKELPMILVNPIPGQEDRNVDFLLNNGVAIYITKTYPVDEAIYQLMINDWRRKHMIDAIRHIKKPNASKDFCEMIVGPEFRARN